MALPKSKAPAVPGTKAALMATEAKLERAVLAPPPEAFSQVGKAPAPAEVKTCPLVPTPDTCCKAPVPVVPPAKTA